MRNLLPALGLLALLGAGSGAAGLLTSPTLTTSGPVSVAGTEASGVFTVEDRTVRQVRYADRGTLRYTFTVTNGGRLPVTVAGLAEQQDDPRLFDLVHLTRGRLSPGESGEFTLSLDMNGCESLSSRAGSFVSRVAVQTERTAGFDRVVTVALPEELRTGSPREVSCPRATATSRPQG